MKTVYLEYIEEEITIDDNLNEEQEFLSDQEEDLSIYTSFMPIMIYRNQIENEETLPINVSDDLYDADKLSIIIVVFAENKDSVKVVVPKAFKTRREAKEWATNLEYKNESDIEKPEWEDKQILHVLVFTIDVED
jgi:hypothetical protein